MRRDSPIQIDDSERDRDSLLEDALCSITGFAASRSGITLTILVILSIASAAYTIRSMTFKTERADLIDPSAEFHQRWINYTETFGDASDLVVVVEGEASEEIQQALDDLAQRMQREPELFSNVFYKVDSRKLREKGMQYLSPRQLENGLEQLKPMRPILQGNWNLLKLDALFTRFRLQLLLRGRTTSREDLQPLFDHARLLADSMHRYLNDSSQFSSPWPQLIEMDRQLADRTEEVVYLMNDARTMGFLKAFPGGDSDDFAGATQSINRLRELIRDVSDSHPGLKFGMTGIPVLENDEMRLSQSDMMIASLISFVGVGLLLFVGFRGFRHPLLGLFMLVVGMAWSFGYTTYVVGHLNILSVSFAVILIGLGIDFGIHYLARYLELRHHGEDLHPALIKTSAGVGTGIVTAAVTTSMAFFCATFTQFLGVAELGIIAGGGILLCAIATFLVLPALVSISDRNVEPRKLPTPFQVDFLRNATARFPFLVALVSSGVILAIGCLAFKQENDRIVPVVRYDSNLLNLQAEGLSAVKWQKRIFQNADNSLLFAVSIANSREEARALRKKFEALPSVHHVEEQASSFSEHPHQKTELLVRAFQTELTQLPDQPPTITGLDPAGLGNSIERFVRSLQDSKHPAAESVVTQLTQFLRKFDTLSLLQQQRFLNAYQQQLIADLLQKFQSIRSVSNPDPVVLSDLPRELTSRFVSPDGKWLLQIYPKEQIWDAEPLGRFVDDIRSVDPEATGTPLQNFEASYQIKESYRAAAVYALVVICLVLLVDFLDRDHKLLTLLPPVVVIAFAAVTLHTRRVEFHPVFLVATYLVMIIIIAAILDFKNLRDALLALVPPVCGGVLMFGVLGYYGIDLNPANLIVLPLILGIGVDDGVHVVHDFRLQHRHSRNRRYRTSASTINAILLTSLTSMIGFGSMMVASHRGLYSVGLVLVIGVGSCLFVSLVTLPAILTLISNWEFKSNRNTSPDVSEKSSNTPETDTVNVEF